MPSRLTEAERREALPALAAAGWVWLEAEDAIHRRWVFRDFDQAWAFMVRVAAAAAALDHHPDWTNRFRLVDITLRTHDCGGLSALDLALARAIDAASRSFDEAHPPQPSSAPQGAPPRST